MTTESSLDKVNEALADVPMYDIHGHLTSDELNARGLHDLMLFHMLVSDYYAAGCPEGRRPSEFPQVPGEDEIAQRIEQAINFQHDSRNTSTAWMLRTILADLYDWDEPITLDNWRRLDGMIRERSGDDRWSSEMMDRSRVARAVGEYARRGKGSADSMLDYALEWGFFTRAQWGEFDTGLYEAERAWSMTEAAGPTMIGSGGRPEVDRRIRNAADAKEAVRHYVAAIPTNVIAQMTHLSTDIDYVVPSDDEFEAAVLNRANAGLAERSIYAAYLNELLLEEMEEKRPEIAFQFSFGAEPLPFETGARVRQTTLREVGGMIARHPGLRFQVVNAVPHANHSLITMARELPNLSLAGYWWHSFYPDSIRRQIGERLDMLPVNKQCGFFSDAYCLEWQYAKAKVVRQALGFAMAERVDRGQYNLDDAVSISRSILFDAPHSLLGMEPRAGWVDPMEKTNIN